MIRSVRHHLLALALAAASAGIVQAETFTYRGYLEDGGAPAEGRYDLQLTLYADAQGNAPLAVPIELNDVAFSEGRFTVAVPVPMLPPTVDSGWLAVAVKSSHDGSFWPLSEKSQVNLRGGICPASWALDGNAGTDPAAHFLGTLDNTAVVVRPSLRIRSRQSNFSPTLSFRTSDDAAVGSISGSAEGLNYNGAGHLWRSGLTPLMNLASNGNLGIGTGFGDPAARVHVQTDGGTAARFERTTDGGTGIVVRTAASDPTAIGSLEFQSGTTTNGRLQHFHSSDTGGTLVARSEGLFAVRTGGNNTRLRISETGDVGIGPNITPTARLDVVRTAGSADPVALFRTGSNTHMRLQTFVVSGSDVGFLTLNRNTAPVPGFPIHVGTNTSNGNGAHLLSGGAWTNGSSRTFKHTFEPVDAQNVLDKVVAMPIATWSYHDADSIRHMGPVAEDFHAAFGLGNDDKYIGTVDADGVALAAIQGLNAKLEASQGEVATLRQELALLRQEHDAERRALRAELVLMRDLLMPAVAHGGR